MGSIFATVYADNVVNVARHLERCQHRTKDNFPRTETTEMVYVRAN